MRLDLHKTTMSNLFTLSGVGVAIGLGTVISVITMNSSWSSADNLGTSSDDDDFSAIVNHLVDRTSQMPQGMIKYTDYEMTMSEESYFALRDLVISNQFAPISASTVLEGLQSTSNVLVWRSWEGNIVFSPAGWRQHVILSDDLAAVARLQESVDDVQYHIVPSVREYEVSVLNGERSILEDRRFLILQREPDMSSPLRSFDISLAPWQQAFVADPVPNQEITARVTDEIAQITYRNNIHDQGWPVTTYTFDVSRGFAPHTVTSHSERGLIAERVYAYGSWDEDQHLDTDVEDYPTLRLLAEATPDGNLAVRLRLVSSWNVQSVDIQQLYLPLPPQYIRIDQRNVTDDEHDGISEMIAPTLTEWFAAIVEHFGTSNLDFDLNKDGTVDFLDLVYLLEECNCTDWVSAPCRCSTYTEQAR